MGLTRAAERDDDVYVKAYMAFIANNPQAPGVDSFEPKHVECFRTYLPIGHKYKGGKSRRSFPIPCEMDFEYLQQSWTVKTRLMAIRKSGRLPTKRDTRPEAKTESATKTWQPQCGLFGMDFTD